MDIARAFLGIAVLLLIAFAVSNNRRRIRPRVVVAALLTQIAIGAFMLFVPAGKVMLATASNAVNHVLEFGNQGIKFLFGGLVTAKMFELFGDTGFVFAFRVLSTHILGASVGLIGVSTTLIGLVSAHGSEPRRSVCRSCRRALSSHRILPSHSLWQSYRPRSELRADSRPAFRRWARWYIHDFSIFRL
jgi:hypothetical protein